MTSVTCSSGDVMACASFIINGTLDVILARASRTMPNGSFSCSLKVLSFIGSRASVAAISFCPMPSLAPQRLREATQSLEVTGVPSCHFRPSLRVKV